MSGSTLGPLEVRILPDFPRKLDQRGRKLPSCGELLLPTAGMRFQYWQDCHQS